MNDALIIIDMQRWMFRTPERAAQLPSLVPNVYRLAQAYNAAGRPIIGVRTFLNAADTAIFRTYRNAFKRV